MPPDHSSEQWFVGQRTSNPDEPDRFSDIGEPPSPKAQGELGWAIGLAAFGGAVGGVAMVFVAREVARRFHVDADILGTVGRPAARFGLRSWTGAIVLSALVGALVGMPIGALLRYSLRFVARTLAGMLLVPVLWTLVHAFVLKPFLAGSLGSLPFGPMIAGAAAYGLCVALIRPPRKLPELSDGS